MCHGVLYGINVYKCGRVIHPIPSESKHNMVSYVYQSRLIKPCGITIPLFAGYIQSNTNGPSVSTQIDAHFWPIWEVGSKASVVAFKYSVISPSDAQKYPPANETATAFSSHISPHEITFKAFLKNLSRIRLCRVFSKKKTLQNPWVNHHYPIFGHKSDPHCAGTCQRTHPLWSDAGPDWCHGLLLGRLGKVGILIWMMYIYTYIYIYRLYRLYR